MTPRQNKISCAGSIADDLGVLCHVAFEGCEETAIIRPFVQVHSPVTGDILVTFASSDTTELISDATAVCPLHFRNIGHGSRSNSHKSRNIRHM